MKNILSLLLLTIFTSSIAMAQSDSVGVFHRPEKVIVLINEGNQQATTRLSDMMDFLGVDSRFEALSSDQNIKITCARAYGAASCTFRFFPGKNSEITTKKLEASATLSDLNLQAEGSFEFYFESSMEDKFLLKIVDGNVAFSASKKILNP